MPNRSDPRATRDSAGRWHLPGARRYRTDPLLQTRETAHRNGYQVARHLLPQDIGFVLLCQQHILLEAVVLRQADGLRRQQLLVGALNGERDRVSELVLCLYILGRHRESALYD